MKNQEYVLIGDELLVCVLNKFPKNTFLFESEDDLHSAFYKASLKPEYRNLFKWYHFDEDGIMPHSKEIAEGLDTMVRSHILDYVQFKGYQISSGINFREGQFIVKKLDNTKKKKIKDLSSYLKKELKKQSSINKID